MSAFAWNPSEQTKSLLNVHHCNETVSHFLLRQCGKTDLKLIQSQDSLKYHETNCTVDKVGAEGFHPFAVANFNEFEKFLN